MGCLSIIAIPTAGLSFFFSAWIIMVFWGILAEDVGVNTVSYPGAMLVTIALWIALAPLIGSMGKRYARGGRGSRRDD